MLDNKFITAGKIFTGDKWMNDHFIEVSGDRVVAVAPLSALPANEKVEKAGDIIAPAFIDIQLYGAYGRLLAVFPEAETLRLIHSYCLAGGAGLFLPTVATNTTDVV